MNMLLLKKKSPYDFETYINRFNNFYLNNYSKLNFFWKTFNGEIDPKILNEFNYLYNEYPNVVNAFEQIKKGKIDNLDYFDFSELLSNIGMSLEIVKNLPKWLKTSSNFVDVFEEPFIYYLVRKGDTFEKIAKKFYGNSEDFDKIMEYNGLRYLDVNANDWAGKRIKIPARSKIRKNIDGIIDGLVGENILGKDINYNFAFVSDDIETYEGFDCFSNSVKLLLQETPKTSIPEFPELGNSVSNIIGKNLGALSYPMIENDFRILFRIDPTIEDFKIKNVNIVDDALLISFVFSSVLGDVFEQEYSTKFNKN